MQFKQCKESAQSGGSGGPATGLPDPFFLSHHVVESPWHTSGHTGSVLRPGLTAAPCSTSFPVRTVRKARKAAVELQLETAAAESVSAA